MRAVVTGCIIQQNNFRDMDSRDCGRYYEIPERRNELYIWVYHRSLMCTDDWKDWMESNPSEACDQMDRLIVRLETYQRYDARVNDVCFHHDVAMGMRDRCNFNFVTGVDCREYERTIGHHRWGLMLPPIFSPLYPFHPPDPLLSLMQ